MDLSAIYSKTPKGLRARASLIGGLSSHLMKVLTHVDGSSRAKNILLKFDKLTPQQLSADLARLEQEGYIRLATVSTAPDDSWALTINFEPMVVEEFQSEEELEAVAQAQKAQQARQLEQQQAEQQVKQQAEQEERRLAEEQKAEKKLQKLREKEKAKAETKVKAQLEEEKQEQEVQEKQRQELERMALEEARKEADAAAKLKAQQEAERIEQQQAAERAAKLEEEARLKAELKAREAAEQAEAEAEASTKENARREIERISRESEEAQKKAEAEAKAKLEAELAAKQEAERKAQAEAEQAKMDAEAKALAEKAAREAEEQEKIRQEIAQVEAAAKSKAAQELKEKARLEIANVLRKAEQDRKEAAAQAKEQKLEAKRQAKAEQEAKLQLERKAKEEAKQKKLKALAEEKAKAEAVEIASKNALEEERKHADAAKLAADLLVKTGLEQQEATRQNEELIAQQTSDALRASLVAEEHANLAAKEQARLEMERIGREADLVQQKTTAEQHVAEVKKGLPNIDNPNNSLPVLDDFDAAEAAEEAAFQEEEQAEEAVEKIQRTIAITTSEKASKQLAENVGRVDIRNAAIAEAEAMVSVHGKTQSFVSAKKVKQWLASGSKVMFIYMPALVLLLLALLHFVNLSSLIKPIEKLATESVGEPVAIKKVHASLWPQPHLVLEQIVIGTSSRIDAIHVLPEAASLFDASKVVKSLVIEGLNIEQANFGQPLQWASNISKGKNLKVKQINIKNLTLTIRDLQLESFDGKVTLTDAGTISAIELVSSNNALLVMISPQASDYAIVLQAANWTLPFNQKMMFSALNAKAVASQNQINFYQIKGELYGGNLTGQANIQWPEGASPWQGSGNFVLANANTEQLLNTFGSAVIVDGKLALEGDFSGKAPEASKLTDAATLNASFDVRQGSIKGIELASAVLSRGSRSLAGDSTNFDKLTGSIRIDQDQYQFGKLALFSSQFNANGYINISANQTVTGRVSADLAAQSRRLKANFNVTGRGKDLKSH